MQNHIQTLRAAAESDSPDKGQILADIIYELAEERNMAIEVLSMTIGKSPQEILDSIRHGRAVYEKLLGR